MAFDPATHSDPFFIVEDVLKNDFGITDEAKIDDLFQTYRDVLAAKSNDVLAQRRILKHAVEQRLATHWAPNKSFDEEAAATFRGPLDLAARGAFYQKHGAEAYNKAMAANGATATRNGDDPTGATKTGNPWKDGDRKKIAAAISTFGAIKSAQLAKAAGRRIDGTLLSEPIGRK